MISASKNSSLVVVNQPDPLNFPRGGTFQTLLAVVGYDVEPESFFLECWSESADALAIDDVILESEDIGQFKATLNRVYDHDVPGEKCKGMSSRGPCIKN